MTSIESETDTEKSRRKPIIEEGEALFFLPPGVGSVRPRPLFWAYGWQGPLEPSELSLLEPHPESSDPATTPANNPRLP